MTKLDRVTDWPGGIASPGGCDPRVVPGLILFEFPPGGLLQVVVAAAGAHSRHGPASSRSLVIDTAIVTVIGDRVLRLLFSDGTAGDVDFSAQRWTGVLAPLNDPAYFAEVAADPEAGTLVWPGGIDPAPEPLDEQAKAPPLLVA